MAVSFDFQNVDMNVWKFYKDAVASFWTVEEVDLESDIKDWNSLTDNERFFVKKVLAFFASSDIIVADNVAMNFSREFDERDIRFFYDFQTMIENINSEMYTTLLERYVQDKESVSSLLKEAQGGSSIAKKAEWMQKWMTNQHSLYNRIVAFACVEGIFFSASFCSIFWLRKRGLMPGLCFANELIMRDEGLHRDFACLLHRTYTRCPKDTVIEIIKDSVDLELDFVRECLPVSLIGMNEGMMCDYVKYVADHLSVSLIGEKIYDSKNPFDFMGLISLQGKSNFFEKRVSEYRKAGVGMDNKLFLLNDDF